MRIIANRAQTQTNSKPDPEKAAWYSIDTPLEHRVCVPINYTE
jgi:hypothetical protein